MNRPEEVISEDNPIQSVSALDPAPADMLSEELELPSAPAPISEEEAEQAAEIADRGIEIAPMTILSEMNTDENDEMLFIQLGDYVIIDSKKYQGQTRGRVYYRSLEKISIKPDGVSNLVHEFEVTQTEEEEVYNDEDGVSAIYIIDKRKFESFVEQQDFRVRQVVDTLDEKGELTGSYRISKVDKENDSISLQPMDDPESEFPVVFGFIGIPSEEPFRMISIREFSGEEEESVVNNEASSLESDQGQVKEEAEEEEEEEEEISEEQRMLKSIVIFDEIEIVKPIIYREAASHEQRIPDHLQKVDAMNDFVNSLDPSLQKDPHALRQVRMLVETLYHLNKETIEYDDEGEILGAKKLSMDTVADLVTSSASIPMGRPILQVSKRLYTLPEEGTEEEEEKGELAIPMEAYKEQVFTKPFIRELEQMIENKSPLVASIMNGPNGSKTIVREWLQQQTFVKEYAPWVSGETDVKSWMAATDTEFFRSEPPQTDELSEGVHELQPVIRGYVASHSKEAPPILDEIPFSIEKALGPTYRKGADRKKQLLLQPEKATLEGYLLFPQRALSYLGKKRSYHLAIDSGRSQLPMKTMRMLLEELGEPVDKNSTSNNILLLKAVGGSLGTIPLKSYISGLHIPALGWADTFHTLIHYGLDHFELYPALYRVLREKMILSQAQVITSLAKLRTILLAEMKSEQEQEKEQEKQVTELVPSSSIWETIAFQEILSKSIEDYQRINPTLAGSDIGKTLHLIKHHDNFFQVTAGKNPLLTAVAVWEAYNTEYLDILRIQSRLRQVEREEGKRPRKNTCAHVADMVSVRRLTDDTERFFELTKVFKRYQGDRKDNWFHCNLCKENLLCIHERLQLQAYLHPKEKDILEKEIILQCSGGQFQGKYICRNCGQAIRDLDFDNHMEFDDNGRPLSGGGAIEDEEAMLEDRVEDLLKTDVETTEKVTWKMTMEERNCYDVVRILSERVGIFLDQNGYMTIVRRTFQYMNKLPPRSVYAKFKGIKMDYDTYHARHLIAYLSVFLLIEIQTKKPDYVIRYRLQGCKSTSFEGFPLDTDPDKKEGLEYIGCAIASIRLKQYPWKDTGYMSEPNDVKRLHAVMYYMTLLIPKVLEDATIQAELAEKRRYLADVMGRSSGGSEDIPRDMIFPTFLPDLKGITAAEAAEAENVITPEIAEKMGVRGHQALVRLWIRRAHQFARESLSLIRHSPFLETTCCISPLTQPHAVWSTLEDMPPLPKRSWRPMIQGSALVTHFVPRPQDLAVAEADKELFYRIFLKYCFQNERIGHPHELNLTHRCIWCGFQFPTHPRLMDTEKQGKPALQDQQVTIDTDSFTSLLDTIHTVHEVIPVSLLSRTPFERIMMEFGSVTPPPIENWSMIMGNTLDELMKIKTNGASAEETRGEILVALGPLSDAARQYQESIRIRFGKEKHMKVMEEIVGLSWNNFFQVLQSYFITQFERMISGFSKTSLFIPIELKTTLSEKHVDDLKEIMLNHLSGFNRLSSQILDNPLLDLAKAKIQYYLEQMSEIIRFRDKIRGLTLPGRKHTLQYIQRCLFYGPLAILVDSTHVPENAPIQSAVKEINNPSIQYLLLLIHGSLEKYSKERLSYDEDKIKHMIAVQAEKERIHIVKMFDEMSDEERAIEKMNKKLGLGKWAVGGTKVIYSYDKDYYDREREFRERAGMHGEEEKGMMSAEFGDEGMFDSMGQLLPAQGRIHDNSGLPIFSDSELEEGYDFSQYNEDD